ncbi:tetratricopeptide repeat protein [archaeon]|nr:MAG: tetratricopeptide repeat protein [archaeon]
MLKDYEMPSEIVNAEKQEIMANLINTAQKEVYIISDDLNEVTSSLRVSEALERKANIQGYVEKHSRVGQELCLVGKYREAIIELEKVRDAVEQFENQRKFHDLLSTLYNNLGFCYLRFGDYNRSKLCLEQALYFNPKRVFVHNNLGEVYEGRGEPESAIGEYKKELQNNPNHPTAIQSLERLQNHK